MARRADADLHAREHIGAEVGDDVLDAVVPAGGALVADAQLAERQRNVVVDNEHMVARDLIEPRRLAHRLAGEVHIGLRHHQQHARPAEFDQLRQRAEAQAVAAQALLVNEPLGGHEADVVARVLILLAVVPQTDEQPLRGTGDFLSKKHDDNPRIKKSGLPPLFLKCP